MARLLLHLLLMLCGGRPQTLSQLTQDAAKSLAMAHKASEGGVALHWRVCVRMCVCVCVWRCSLLLPYTSKLFYAAHVAAPALVRYAKKISYTTTAPPGWQSNVQQHLPEVAPPCAVTLTHSLTRLLVPSVALDSLHATYSTRHAHARLFAHVQICAQTSR